MMNIKSGLVVAIGLMIVFAGCGSREIVVRPAPEVTTLNRIAVFPLQNLSGVPDVGDAVTQILVSSLFNANLVDIVEPGEIQQFILRSRIRMAGELDLDRIRDASRQLGADGLLFGSVNDYSTVTTEEGDLPSVSITLRLVDASSGNIVWAVTHSLQGDFKEKVFGIGRVESAVILSEIVVGELVEALGVAMYPNEGKYYTEKVKRKVREELKPEKKIGEPVIPTAPTQAEVENIELEKERAHIAVQQEWETIKKLNP
jgi:TolB-like protein